MAATKLAEAGVCRINLADDAGDEGHGRQLIEREQSGPQAIVDIVGIIGDVVGNSRGLRFGACKRMRHQVLALAVLGNHRGYSARSIAPDRPAGIVRQRPVVFDETFKCFPRQVQPVEVGVATLEFA